MGIRVPYSTNFKDLQKVYDSLIGTVKTAEGFINEKKLKVQRKITKINYDNETKKMMVDYDDGTSKVFNEAEDFSGEGKALAFKKDDVDEVYIVLPCGRRPRVGYNNYGYFDWTDFKLIKKVDYRELEKKEQ